MTGGFERQPSRATPLLAVLLYALRIGSKWIEPRLPLSTHLKSVVLDGRMYAALHKGRKRDAENESAGSIHAVAPVPSPPHDQLFRCRQPNRLELVNGLARRDPGQQYVAHGHPMRPRLILESSEQFRK
jgi:hypothetical protein